MAKHNEWNARITSPWNRVYRRDNYLEGSVITALGIVYVYTQGGVFAGIEDEPYTTMQFVWKGRIYSRGIPRRYTSRGVVTVANRFAREIAAPKGKE